MEFILFDDSKRLNFLPIAHTKAIANIRCGIKTILEKWEFFLQGTAIIQTADYLMPIYNPQHKKVALQINARYFPNDSLAQAIKALKPNIALLLDEEIIAINSDIEIPSGIAINLPDSITRIQYEGAVDKLEHIWDIFGKNEAQILADYEWLTATKTSASIPDFVTTIVPENIFVEEGAVLNPCIINATNARIYIGKNAEIMEGCLLRGTIALGEKSVIKMGAKVYGGTTIGPGCKVGGEVQNVVFYANSNKGHDGYLGNAIIGEWCNIGADTNCSNLKNDYGMVSIYDEATNKKINTGLQFCGLIMGDHSKTAINTMFNTGTVVGVGCSIFGSTFPPVFIPSFSWGGSDKMISYVLRKSIEACNSMMARRGMQLSAAEVSALEYIYENTKALRKS